jgi:hypothetical protein
MLNETLKNIFIKKGMTPQVGKHPKNKNMLLNTV